jgi:hypothetical protein
MANGNGFTAAQVIEAIRESRGFVSTISKRLGCERTYVYRLIEKYPTAKEALENEREGNKDFAEGKLMQQIDAGNITAIIFYLKTQAKNRGYVEKQEISLLVEQELEKALDHLEKELPPEVYGAVINALVGKDS